MLLFLLCYTSFDNKNVVLNHNASCLIVLLIIFPFVIGYDIIIYAATPGGIAAAVSAARTSSSLSIAIIESTSYIGGMATAGGIGLSDCKLIDVRKSFVCCNLSNSLSYLIIANGSIAQEWALNNRKYYENVTRPIYVADMNIGTQRFHDILSKYSNIELITKMGPMIGESLEMNGTRIVQFTTANDHRTWKASVFIDARYKGDLLRYSHASYTWGRESKQQYNESYAGVRPYSTFNNFLRDYPVNAT